MKKALGLLTVILALGLTVVTDAEARRLGGAKSSGMKRQAVTQPAGPAPASPAAPSQAAPAAGAAATAAAPAAAAAKRSWMGPVAGLAAGLGLAALASHLGFGEAFANMMMIALLVMVALAVLGFIMRKRAGGTAMAGASHAGLGGLQPQQPPQPHQPLATRRSPLAGGSLIGSGLAGGAAAGGAASPIPADFDAVSFARNAKSQFLALQAANDSGDLARLRQYLTPEMFEVVQAEIAERNGATQRTEVFGLEAQVLEVAEEGADYVVSVRFTGSIREQAGATPEDLDEIWHLTKPRTGQGGWVIAGIQQVGNWQ